MSFSKTNWQFNIILPLRVVFVDSSVEEEGSYGLTDDLWLECDDGGADCNDGVVTAKSSLS